MANIRISDLTDLTNPTGSSVFPISHQGATRKITVDNLVNYINNISTGIDPTYATVTGLDASGISLTNTINSLSGSLNLSGISLINTINSLSGSLNLSGTRLTNNITSLSGLFTGYTGSLDYTFATDSQLNSTGENLNNVILSLSGSLNSSGIYLINTINVSGINLINTTNSLSGTLNLSGINLSNKIDSFSGLFTGYTGSLDYTFATDSQLNITGSGLLVRIISLSGYSVLLSGDQTISGTKTFTSRPIVNGTGILLSGEIAALPTTIIYTTGNQNISGFKLFKSGLATTNISGDGGNLFIQGSTGDTASNTSIYLQGGSGSFFGAGNIYLIGGTGVVEGGGIRILGGKDQNDPDKTYKGPIDLISSNIKFNFDQNSERIVTFYKTGLSGPALNLDINQKSVNINNNCNITGIASIKTGVFNDIQINNKVFTSYNYITGGIFYFDNSSFSVVNSLLSITGILPSSITSGINYYVKNLNTGILTITGSGQRTIDGFLNVNLYQNDSVNLLGINNIGYTGWISTLANGGVS